MFTVFKGIMQCIYLCVHMYVCTYVWNPQCCALNKPLDLEAPFLAHMYVDKGCLTTNFHQNYQCPLGLLIFHYPICHLYNPKITLSQNSILKYNKIFITFCVYDDFQFL